MSGTLARAGFLFAGMAIAYADMMPASPTLLDPRTICLGLAIGLVLMSYVVRR